LGGRLNEGYLIGDSDFDTSYDFLYDRPQMSSKKLSPSELGME